MTTAPLKPGHDQAGHRVRMEWGPTGASAITRPGDVAVVVDVLSFTTTLSVAVERIVLPSPNGSTIAAALVDSGATVAGGCLRNAAAVAAWAAQQVGAGSAICVIPAGERWPDDTLRPCVEDLWGAGAVVAALEEGGWSDLSPEARLAATAWREARGRIGAELAGCAGGVELAAAGFDDDVTVAAQVDATATVPVLTDGAFTARSPSD